MHTINGQVKRELRNKTETQREEGEIVMHKKNLHRCTDSVRIARAAQVRLDEISDKIERDKHRSRKSNYHEKIKLWNELKSIHRVFEPLYVLKEGEERLTNNQPVAKVGTMQSVCDIKVDGKVNTSGPNHPRLPRRAIFQTTNLHAGTRRRHTEPQLTEERLLLVNNSKGQAQLDKSTFLLPWAHSWCAPESISSSGSSQVPSASRAEREHLAKLRSAAEGPRISNSMSTVTMGYLAFKRVLRIKQQSDSMERKVVDSRFRTRSMVEAQLGANSRLLMPEQPDLAEEKLEVLQGTFSTQANHHLVRKNKNKPNLKKLRSAPPRKRQLSSSLSCPGRDADEIPTDYSKNLITPNLLRAKSVEVPMKSEKSETVKPETITRLKTFAANTRELPSEGDEVVEKYGTFEEIPTIKMKFRNNEQSRFREASKLLQP